MQPTLKIFATLLMMPNLPSCQNRNKNSFTYNYDEDENWQFQNEWEDMYVSTERQCDMLSMPPNKIRVSGRQTEAYKKGKQANIPMIFFLEIMYEGAAIL